MDNIKTYAVVVNCLFLLTVHHALAQNTVLNSSTSIAGGGARNLLIGPANTYSGSFSGSDNVAIGRNAAIENTTGYFNVFVGNGAGRSNTTGYYNTFIGTAAGSNTSTGTNNSFVGLSAGTFNTSGDNNSFLGNEAGYLNTLGTNNTFVGNEAGRGNRTGHDNTFIGTYVEGVGSLSTSIRRAAALGYKAKVGVNDGLVLGDPDNVSVKVGIGTAYPDQKLTLKGNMNFVAYDNSLMLKNQPFLHFNEHESLALGLRAKIPAGAEKTLVLGSDETTVQIPGLLGTYQPNAGQFLTVNEQGKVILAQPRVQVAQVADWSDKVFEEGYALRPLGEVEEFVKKNKHLPGVPSAEQMVAEGVESTAFNAKLLEKIEELTLYVVALEKRLKELEKK